MPKLPNKPAATAPASQPKKPAVATTPAAVQTAAPAVQSAKTPKRAPAPPANATNTETNGKKPTAPVVKTPAKKPEPVREEPKREVRPVIYDSVAAEIYSCQSISVEELDTLKNAGLVDEAGNLTDLGKKLLSPLQKVSGKGGITYDIAKSVLGWETEKQYQSRSKADNPGTKDEHWVFGDFLLKDGDGNKIRCWNNLDNRPFDEEWSNGLCQTILNGDWAGPLTIPGETVNGSTIVISRTGNVESGQHSLIALIKAYDKWLANKEAYPFWADKVDASGQLTGPVIESVIITGTSEDSRVLRTVDNCKPRSLADVFYTSELFRSKSVSDRREYSKMLSSAVDLLWGRTGAKGYRTHTECVGFLDRHKRLLKCIDHIFVENSAKSASGSRKISNSVKMSAGQCASLCFLMGCSGKGTDGETYRNGMPPTEKELDRDRWGKAKEFWAMIGSKSPTANELGLDIVRTAINRLKDFTEGMEEDKTGLGGRSVEKMAIVQKAWDGFVSGYRFQESDFAEGGALWLSYTDKDEKGNVMADGKIVLLDTADFKGIDVPNAMDRKATNDPPESEDPAAGESNEGKSAADYKPAPMDEKTEEIRKQRAAEAVEKLKKLQGATANTVLPTTVVSESQTIPGKPMTISPKK